MDFLSKAGGWAFSSFSICRRTSFFCTMFPQMTSNKVQKIFFSPPARSATLVSLLYRNKHSARARTHKVFDYFFFVVTKREKDWRILTANRYIYVCVRVHLLFVCLFRKIDIFLGAIVLHMEGKQAKCAGCIF